jgi:hypothetical protein
VIVEFVGPSCAGKSTLIVSTSQHLRLLGVTARHHRADRDGAEHDPAAEPGSEAEWLAANPGILDDHHARILLRCVAFVRSLPAGASVHLVDEGPIKRYTHTLSRYSGRELLADWLPRPDLAVFVDCDPRVRATRVRRTNRRHAQQLTDDELHARHEHSLARTRWLVGELAVPLITLVFCLANSTTLL